MRAELKQPPSFDRVARDFERDRALPDRVPIAIRNALVEHALFGSPSAILEIGCGAGRTGAAFCAAGDRYVGVDSSIEMLRVFRRKHFAEPPRLVHANGTALPFGGARFGAVMLMHVLTASNWRDLLPEARRVVRNDGVLVVGKTEGPVDGIDARMRTKLNELLGTDPGSAAPDRGAMQQWLSSQRSRRLDVVAAEWTVERTPGDFLRRKQSAARFTALSASLQKSALQSLAEWTEKTLGPLDTPHREASQFRLQLYWFDAGRERCAP